MSRQALSRYHDLAVTGKQRGRSIGFAGVGIKLGLLVSDQVVTETRTPRAKRPLAWVNDAHPACRRAAASRSEGYHVALTAAMALAALAVTPVDAPRFMTEFLARWGETGRDGRTDRR
ncbi:MAG: hypothetical protein ACREK5_09555 [Gemmatimonadota bacterium]